MRGWVRAYRERPRILSTARSSYLPPQCPHARCLSVTPIRAGDPRLHDLGQEISDKYATIRSEYGKGSSIHIHVYTQDSDKHTTLATPKHPIVLAHGLLGFSELRFAPLPKIQYWHGIKDALKAAGATVHTGSVPPSSSIETRATKLSTDISSLYQPNSGSSPPEAVNIIAHSMGGLDARYMIAHLPPTSIKIASLTTIATPHEGSSFASALLDRLGKAPPYTPLYLPNLYRLIRRTGLSTEAFSQLTSSYMKNEFNPNTPDHPDTRYFSFGAATDEPSPFSPFRLSWGVINRREGPNDGLVSVKSSRWGEYKGTLVGVSHLDLINWSNRVRWSVREWMGLKRNFNAIALYLDIADMLAREGL